MFDHDNELALLKRALDVLDEGFAHLPQHQAGVDVEAAWPVLEQLARCMRDNYPYFHPQYAGQMLKPPHPVARIAYALALWINPNNHALDGGRASSALEKECVSALGAMFGWDHPLGHLTGGGTMANMEALWVSGRLRPGKKILASDQAHYTHGRISEVLQLPFSAVAADASGRMDLEDLERQLGHGDVGTVVVTLGTTGLGTVDPLADILAMQQRHDFRIHVDAAYGGYFVLCDGLGEEARRHFDSMHQVDSIVIDPHKHGLQPYGCGCVLFRDREVARIYLHESPYTYYSSDELHLGEISLECSRAGAAATALWATQQLLPMARGGRFAGDLDRCLAAATELYRLLAQSSQFHPLYQPELDILVYAVAADDTRDASQRAARLFDRAAENELHLALIDLPTSLVHDRLGDMEINSETVTCLRSVLMKSEQVDWTRRIFELLCRCADAG
ncbi:MAG: aminotransferase class I/II-fold pyridoxal phosphate-dependent enzyme [Xanthomonadales bacterium]|nr:aminotransferase class I/II-fold pyridoxal phosphate-dependent enzyme [Xanthomonadales bacterium]